MSHASTNGARHQVMGVAAGSSTIRLFEVDPDLARFLTPQEHRAADALVVPVQTVPDNEVDVSALLADANAFGALVLDGMLVHHVRITNRPALRLLGSGDMFCVDSEPATSVLAESHYRGVASTRLALLGNNVLIAALRAPRIVQGLLARMAEQSEREAAHLAISQLPRVEHRLMALMWLLAEKWGHVTLAGTVLPLALTHETLGGLIGSRRPTVTLALSQLSDGGRLLKQDRGWLITERPPGVAAYSRELDAPELLKSQSRSSGRERQRRNGNDSNGASQGRASLVREEIAASHAHEEAIQPRLLITGELVISREHPSDGLVLVLHGELDIASAPALERELLDAESVGADRILIDLSRLQFMDCSGLHTILRAQQRANEQHHQFALVPGPQQVHRMFELTGTVGLVSFETPDGRNSGSQASELTKSSANAGELLSYTTAGNIRVLAFHQHADARAIQTLGKRISALATSEPQPTCVVIDTTGVHARDRGRVAGGLVANLHTAAHSGIPIAVVSSDGAVRDALRHSGVEQLVIASTIKQAMQTCRPR